MVIPYWLESTLAALPAVLWMFVGVGIPYALALLPRRTWRDLPVVGMVALAAGPAVMTAWMLVLGMIGGAQATGDRIPLEAPLLTFSNIWIGSAILTALALGVVAWKRARTPALVVMRPAPLAKDERVIVWMLAAALVLCWFATAYWNFTNYDTLWVYGYEGRLYALLGYIPENIGYYPQFLPLQYTYAQLGAQGLTGTLIDDHAARAVVPFLHLGSILAAYFLGKTLFNRRVGVFMAALWGLYPHVSEWAAMGDLEIPLTFAFTGAAAFFLRAWFEPERGQRRHDAALAGFFLGVAMWTKPTAGAFIFGVVLLVALELLRVLWLRLPLRQFWARFEVAAVAGIACLPLGAVWYARNLLYGHAPIVMPNTSWLSEALRGGTELGWILLALAVIVAFAVSRRLLQRTAPHTPQFALIPLFVGVLLIAAGVLPTITEPYDVQNLPHRMEGIEWVLFGGGVALIAWVVVRASQDRLSPVVRQNVIKLAWALALALPYFITWFYSYSYHYRLSFAIVPLLALPTAVMVAYWLPAQTQKRWQAWIVAALCLPGVIMPLYNHGGGWDWLWTDKYSDDFAKLEATNLALVWTVKNLQDDIAENHVESPVIYAPGLQRLPFFFPLEDVRNLQPPLTLAEVEDGDYFIHTQEAVWLYEEFDAVENQVTGALGRNTVMQRFGAHIDSSFWSQIYRLREPERRFGLPRQLETPESPVLFADFAEFIGARVLGADAVEGVVSLDVNLDEGATLQLVWQSTQPTPTDALIYIHLLDAEGNLITNWDSPPVAHETGYYATRFWETGEYVIHQVPLMLDGLPDDVPTGTYQIRIGFYDRYTHERLPVKIAGQTEDGYTLPLRFKVPVAR